MGVDEGRGSGQESGVPSRQIPGQGGPPRAEATGGQEQDAPAAGEHGAGSASGGVPEQRSRRRSSDGSSDTWLISRMREGDASAYEELYRRHAEPVRRYARTCCRDTDTADDLTNEVFARTLQAVRGGKGPETSVRAYLLTSVRHVAAAWARTRKREHLVDDFAVFVQSASSASAATDAETLDLGADVRAMQEAEQTLVLQAFRSLSEHDQMVLWHTAVEGAKPQDVAPLLGKSKGATATAAHRARENLKQAYLQAHVSQALTTGGDCARFADRLGAYARGGLRLRAERGLTQHLAECPACSSAALEVKDLNEHIRVLVPVALIGWFATTGGAKAFGALLTGGGALAASGGAGAAAAAGGVGAAGAGASGSAGGGAAGGAASEGLGAPAKIGIGAGVVVAAGAVLAYALTGGSPEPAKKPRAEPSVAQQYPEPPPEKKPAPKPPAPQPPPEPKPKPPEPEPKPKPKPPEKKPEKPKPEPPEPRPEPPQKPTPKPPEPSPEPPAPPAPPPEQHRLNKLEWDVLDPDAKEKGPTIRALGSGWVWQRQGLAMGGTSYGHGVSMHVPSSVTIDLNRKCTSYEALAGVDDMTIGERAVRFTVYGDGARLWRSGYVQRGDAPVPVRVPLAGVKTVKLVVEPRTHEDRIALADWAQSQIACR